MVEIWIKIEDKPNYSVSSLGRVRNDKTGKMIKPRPDRNGYHRVYLFDGHGHGNEKQVHRLVCDAFYEIDGSGLDVNHLDGDKNNNFVGNLEFCTRSENLKHAYRTKLRDAPHNRCAPVRIVETGEVFGGVRECARYLKQPHSNVSKCVNGHVDTCCGYHIEFYK